MLVFSNETEFCEVLEQSVLYSIIGCKYVFHLSEITVF